MINSKANKVYILGFGSIGGLIGVHLSKQRSYEVIPLFRNLKKLNKFASGDFKVQIKSLYLKNPKIIEGVFPRCLCPETFPEFESIDNLIITCKTYQTKDAILPYLPFIKKDANIILIQNGLGIKEMIEDDILKNSNLSINLFQGVISHGIYQDSTNNFLLKHAGFVDCKISRLPTSIGEMIQTDDILHTDKKSNTLIKCLISLETSLNIKHVTYQELLIFQLEKFLINLCINPVTSILDCKNGELNDIGSDIFREIISESLNILKIAYHPIFHYPPLNANQILNEERLNTLVMSIGCDINGANSSSMRQDIVNLRQTEIDYINGYIVSLGKKLNLPKSHYKINEMISILVKLRLQLNKNRN